LPKVGEVWASPPGPDVRPEHALRVIATGGLNPSLSVWLDEWKQTDIRVVRSEDIYRRMPFNPTVRERLRNSRVLLFGAGSGGGSLALHLARAGIGHLRLADPGRFDIENVLRHEADLTDVERLKAHIMAERMRRINPTIEVQTYTVDLFAEGNETLRDQAFEGVDLVIGGTDRLRVQLRINEEAYRRGLSALYAGCYELAKGGEILVVAPGRTSFCLECLRGGFREPERQRPTDYSGVTSVADYRGEPGLAAAVDFIVNIAAPYALGLLLQGTDTELARLIDFQRNYVLIGGAAAKDFYLFTQPFQVFWPEVKGPRKGCTTCSEPSAAPEDVARTKAEIEKLQNVPPEFASFVEDKEDTSDVQ